MVYGGKATSLRRRLVINAVKRDVTEITGDLDAGTLLASCPWLGDERVPELS